MKLFSNSKSVLGGLVLSASLAMFSGGVAATPIQTCNVAENPCEVLSLPDPLPVVLGLNEFEFDTATVWNADPGTVTLDIFFFVIDEGIEISNAYLTDINNDPITIAQIGSFTGADNEWTFTATWTTASALAIHDFHFECADGIDGLCAGNLNTEEGAFVIGYSLFNNVDVDVPTGVPAPAAAPLLLFGLALTGLGGLVRRRRSALECATA